MGYLDPDAGNRSYTDLRVAELVFAEAGAAGVYSASKVLPAGSTLLDIIVTGQVLWAAGSAATMIVGDGDDPDGYYTAINLKATDLLAGESLSFALAGGKAGAYIANSQVTPRYDADERTISASVTTTGTTATAGRTRVLIVYALAGDDSVNAGYTAS